MDRIDECALETGASVAFEPIEVSGWQPGQDQAQRISVTKNLESYVFTYHCAGQKPGVGFEQKQ